MSPDSSVAIKKLNLLDTRRQTLPIHYYILCLPVKKYSRSSNMLFRKKLFRRNFFSKEKTENIYDGKYTTEKKQRQKSKTENNQVASENRSHQLKSVADGGQPNRGDVTKSEEAHNALLIAKMKCNEWNPQNLSQATLALMAQSNLPAGSPKGIKRSHQSNTERLSSDDLLINLSHPAFQSSTYFGLTSYQSRANQFKRFEKYMNKRTRRTGVPLHPIQEVDSEEDETDL